MLFVLVFGSYPVETNLLFDTLDACLKAEQTMRKNMRGLTVRALGLKGTLAKQAIRRCLADMGRKPRQLAFRTGRGPGVVGLRAPALRVPAMGHYPMTSNRFNRP
jgi:hypothetical protein